MLHEGAPGEVYNLGGGHEQENRDVTSMIIELTGADPSLVRHVVDRAGHDRRYAIDSSKAQDELGWAPVLSFADGFARTVDWYRDNRAWWEPIKSSGGYRAYYDAQYADRLKA